MHTETFTRVSSNRHSNFELKRLMVKGKRDGRIMHRPLRLHLLVSFASRATVDQLSDSIISGEYN